MGTISASVGQGGANRHVDVITVQTLINRNIGRLTPLRLIKVDGRCGEHTILAIKEFQTRILGMPKADGRVDPGGRTLAKLSENESKAFRVYYSHAVSDDHLHAVLLRAAQVLRADVRVTSGDRDKALKVGGKNRSLHLQHRAADFHMTSLTDAMVFRNLQTHGQDIFFPGIAYELIHHGPYTETMGEHVHLGNYPVGRLTGVHCKEEGLTEAGKGHYPTVRVINITG